MAPPQHAVRRGICGAHVDPPCNLPARLFPCGWRCAGSAPNTRRDHPQTPQPQPEETSHA